MAIDDAELPEEVITSITPSPLVGKILIWFGGVCVGIGVGMWISDTLHQIDDGTIDVEAIRAQHARRTFGERLADDDEPDDEPGEITIPRPQAGIYENTPGEVILHVETDLNTEPKSTEVE